MNDIIIYEGAILNKKVLGAQEKKVGKHSSKGQ